MKTWLKDNGTVIGALAGVVVAWVAVLQVAVVGPMNRGFSDLGADMNARFDIQHKYIEARFDAVDQRFDDMNRHFNGRIDDLRAEMNQRFDQQDRRLDFLTNEVSELRKLTVNITERVSRNEGRVDLLSEQLRAAPAPDPDP